jgi:hypothetical protein
MLGSKQELAIEIGHVDGVEINDLDVSKAGKCEILEQFAANPTGTHEQDFTALNLGQHVRSESGFHAAQ